MPGPLKTHHQHLTLQYLSFSLQSKPKLHICHSDIEKQQGGCQTCPLLPQAEPHYGQSRTDLKMPGNSHNLTSKAAEMAVQRKGSHPKMYLALDFGYKIKTIFRLFQD